jgi:AhpD family alkylhydroperoxidase
MKRILLAAALLTGTATSARADEATLKDIQATLGQVPTFLKTFPSGALETAWGDMKALQLNPNTALPGKYKELIGLAVAAQVPCRYCVYFHTEAAKLNGASRAELDEALLVASETRRWSTVLNGNQTDEAQFRAEFTRIGENARAGKINPNTGIKVVDGPSALKDIEKTLGVVPGFFKAYPDVAIAPTWRAFKQLYLNETKVPAKYKELVGLAVASQIPCKFCVVAHTELARLNGASDAEIREAVGMAAITRFWSTYLNGSLADEATFRKEADQIVARFKKTMAKK